MSDPRSSVRIGRIIADPAGLLDAVVEPRETVPGMPPVVWGHGANQNASIAPMFGSRHLLNEFARYGFPCASVSTTALWATGASHDRRLAAAQWLRDNKGAVGPAILVGASMGAYESLVCAVDNPDEVRCVVGLIPATHPEDIRDKDTNGLRAVLDALHGVVWPAPLPDAFNPPDRVAEFSELPVQLWVASNDDVTDPVLANQFGAAIGADVHDLGALGHTDVAMAASDAEAVLDFVADLA